MKIEINIFERCGKRHKHRAVTSQFAGAFYVNSKGVVVVAQQTVPGATALTGQLIFKDQNGNLIKGPGATQDFLVDAVIVLEAATVEFGPASPGTTL